MARVFNLVVFDQVISGDASAPPVFYTSQEHAALLGSVERLQVQLIMRGASGFTASATVEYQFTNAPEYDTWATSSVGKTVSAGSANNLPAVTFMQITSPSDQGAYGCFRITSPHNVSLQLQVVVAGYSD